MGVSRLEEAQRKRDSEQASAALSLHVDEMTPDARALYLLLDYGNSGSFTKQELVGAAGGDHGMFELMGPGGDGNVSAEAFSIFIFKMITEKGESAAKTVLTNLTAGAEVRAKERTEVMKDVTPLFRVLDHDHNESISNEELTGAAGGDFGMFDLMANSGGQVTHNEVKEFFTNLVQERGPTVAKLIARALKERAEQRWAERHDASEEELRWMKPPASFPEECVRLDEARSAKIDAIFTEYEPEVGGGISLMDLEYVLALGAYLLLPSAESWTASPHDHHRRVSREEFKEVAREYCEKNGGDSLDYFLRTTEKEVGKRQARRKQELERQLTGDEEVYAEEVPLDLEEQLLGSTDIY